MDPNRPTVSFYGVHIAPEYLALHDIGLAERILLAIVEVLSRKEGFCYASNAYFAEIMHVSEREIQRRMAILVARDYLYSEIHPDHGGRGGNVRWLWICIKCPSMKAGSPGPPRHTKQAGDHDRSVVKDHDRTVVKDHDRSVVLSNSKVVSVSDECLTDCCSHARARKPRDESDCTEGAAAVVSGAVASLEVEYRIQLLTDAGIDDPGVATSLATLCNTGQLVRQLKIAATKKNPAGYVRASIERGYHTKSDT